MKHVVNSAEMEDLVASTPPAKPDLRTIELVGPAGAGKTTLKEVLSQSNNKMIAGVRSSRLIYLRSLAGVYASLLPTFLRRHRETRWFNWGETRSLLYLKAWHHALRQQSPQSETITLFDQGPIYRLVYLRVRGPNITRSAQFQRWWSRAFVLWASSLDLVVWLDAPNAVLLDRIRKRKRWHPSKQQNDQQAFEFLDMYRHSYEELLDRFNQAGVPRILRFDTSRCSMTDILETVLAACDQKVGEFLPKSRSREEISGGSRLSPTSFQGKRGPPHRP